MESYSVSPLDRSRPEPPAALPQRSWLHRLERLRKLPPWALILVLVAVQLLIGGLDHIAGRGASFFVFYALPIAAVTWLVSRRAGLWMALGSGFVWLAANQSNLNVTTLWSVCWVALGRIVYFGIVAVGTSALRKKLETDAARIQILDEMRQLEMELVNARERQQQRFGQDLHDGLCQQLAALSCAVEALADDLRKRNSPEADDAENIGLALQRSVAEARSLAGGMTSLHVERGGIVNALQMLVQTTNRLGNVPVTLEADGQVKIASAEHATHLYRIAQEAISNAVRHSGASHITVSFARQGDTWELRVDDDGRGFMEATEIDSFSGIGLQTMRFRAHAIGADFEIRPRRVSGTSVCCSLPVDLLSA